MNTLSIVIPVYNCEKYLGKCIDSIYCGITNYSFFEVICVDDGSTDDSLNILLQYSNKYPNLRVITQNNSYAGSARNNGIENANGKYIWFIDADDFIESGSVAFWIEALEKLNPEMVIFNYNNFYSECEIKPVHLFNINYNKTISGNGQFINYSEIDSTEYIRKLIDSSVVPWNKIYSAQFIKENGLFFDTIKSANDSSFYFKAISKCKTVLITDHIFYNYRKNNDCALTGSINEKRLDYSIQAYHSTMSYIDNNCDVLKKEIFKATIKDMMWMLREVDQKEKWIFFQKLIYCFKKDFLYVPDDLYKIPCNEYSIFSLYRSRDYLINVDEKKMIPIVFATDMNYAPYLAVAIQSIIDHSDVNYIYDIYILHATLVGMSNIVRIREMARANIKITFVNISSFLNSTELYSRAHYSKEMFNRILIPEIFSYYSKVLYLDCDMVLLDDVKKLYDIDVTNSTLAAVKCDSNEEMKRYVRNVLKLPNERYFNSGMLLINCANFYKQHIKSKCLELIKQNKSYVCPDQDVLNLTCAETVKILPDDQWNFQWHVGMNSGYNSRYTGQKLIHYTSGNKAWNCPDYDLSKHFWRYARRTTFYEEILFSNVFSVQNLSTNGKKLTNNSQKNKESLFLKVIKNLRGKK